MAAGARRVAVTGLGLVTAIGVDERTVWANLLAGHSGLAPLDHFDLTGNTVRNGAIVDLSLLDPHQRGKLRRADRTVRFAMEASRQALAGAGLLAEVAAGHELPALPVATIWGCGCGPAGTLYQAHRRFAVKGPSGMRPSTVPNCMANSVSSMVSIQYRLQGTNQVIVSACTSGNNAIGVGFRAIRHGYADTVLVGGVDAFFDPFYYGVWENLGVLSTLDPAARALRPFDADRMGTLLGEGAGALLLESMEKAEERGARVRGEVVGYGESSNGNHLTSPSVEGPTRAIQAALNDAGASPEEITLINAHGTATLLNDLTESQAIRATLGRAADGALVSANKSFFGHTLGASGTIESIVTLLSLEARTAPPNLNLDRQDPECDVALVGDEPVELAGELAMKNSFGFGGGNAVVVFKWYAGGAG